MVKRKPYLLLLFSAILFLVFGFFVSTESILDINVHDTYFIITHPHLCWVLTEVFCGLYLIYLILEKAKISMILLLSKIHIYGTLVSVVGIFFPYSLIFDSSEFPLYDDSQYTNLCLFVCALTFLLFQLLFIINIFVSIIKKLCNSDTQ